MRAEAYRRTLYRAGDVGLRTGRRSAAADRWMARHGVREAGVITAWNPMSRLMPEAWNAAAQARLRRELRGARFATGEGALENWREEMLLVALPLPRLHRLARRHRQAAILHIRRGGAAKLVWTYR